MRKNYHLVLAKLVSHSVMKLHQETSSSELENSNKWNWNSSVNLVKKLNGKIRKTFASQWLKDLNINEENMRLRDHDEEELSHYSNATTDIEYRFPFGWGELWGIASRTDFDLKNIVNIQVKTLNITTLKQTKSMFHTVLNHLLVSIVLH